MHFPNIRTIMAYLCLAALPCSTYADNYLKVRVKQCGTLSARVKEAKLQRKQGLRIEGTLNNADLAYLRKLCGRDTAGNAVPAVTHQLDLQQVTFATGGKPFLTKDNTSYAITSAHAIPAGLFDECPIDSVLLPALTDSIGTRAFANTHIRTVKLPDYVVLAKDAYKLNMKLPPYIRANATMSAPMCLTWPLPIAIICHTSKWLMLTACHHTHLWVGQVCAQ
jgi:hypothetical protein